jgi:hypothetical protein
MAHECLGPNPDRSSIQGYVAVLIGRMDVDWDSLLGQPLGTIPNIYFMYTKKLYFEHAHQSFWCAQVCTPRKMVYTIASTVQQALYMYCIGIYIVLYLFWITKRLGVFVLHWATNTIQYIPKKCIDHTNWHNIKFGEGNTFFKNTLYCIG